MTNLYLNMKQIICILCLFSIITFSCKDDDIPRLEKKIESLKEDINGLQSIISLQNAHRARKKIVSAGKFQDELAIPENGGVAKNTLYWLITFSDNAKLNTFSIVANFATVAADGKIYITEHYSLNMILSVGYRVKSQQGIHFRIWSNTALMKNRK